MSQCLLDQVALSLSSKITTNIVQKTFKTVNSQDIFVLAIRRLYAFRFGRLTCWRGAFSTNRNWERMQQFSWFMLFIAQIGPLSFQAAIEHKPGQVEVDCTLQWSLSGGQHVCISNPKGPSKRQLRKTSNARRSQLNQYWSYKPHSNFKPTWKFLKILYVSFKWYFWQK